MYRYVSYSKLSKSLVGENWPGFTMPHFRKERNYTSRQSSSRNSVVYHGFLHCIHSTFGGIESECWVASCRARDSLWMSKVRYLTHMMMMSWFAVLASLCVGMMMTWLYDDVLRESFKDNRELRSRRRRGETVASLWGELWL